MSIGIFSVCFVIFIVVIVPWLFVIWVKRDMTKAHEKEMHSIYGASYVKMRKRQGWK